MNRGDRRSAIGEPMEYKDYYRTLGISKSADEKEIRRAYRKLAQQFHPDKNPGDKGAEEKFKEINEAYEVLKDPVKRSRYDQFGSSYQQWERMGGQPGGFDWSQWTSGGPRVEYSGDLGDLFGGGGFSDFFNSLFGGGAARARARSGPGGGFRPAEELASRDVEQTVEITLEEAYSGTTRTLQKDGNRIQVKIPPGARTGTRVRVKGKGTDRAGLTGDLYLVVNVASHPVLERKENDLHMELKVDLYTALLGGVARLETPGGVLELTIPPESQPDQTIRLAGRGMPYLRSPEKRGDLYVRLAVQLPRNLSHEEKTLFQQLAALRREGNQ